jgi:hypothetical protein
MVCCVTEAMRGGACFLLILCWLGSGAGLHSRPRATSLPFSLSSLVNLRGGLINSRGGRRGQKIALNVIPLTEEIISNKLKAFERVPSLDRSVDLLNLQKISLDKLFQRTIDNWSSGTDEIRIRGKMVEIKTQSSLLGRSSVSFVMRTLSSENTFSLLLEVLPQQRQRVRDRGDQSSSPSILIQLTDYSLSSPSTIEVTYAVSAAPLLPPSPSDPPPPPSLCLSVCLSIRSLVHTIPRSQSSSPIGSSKVPSSVSEESLTRDRFLEVTRAVSLSSALLSRRESDSRQ